MIAMKKAAGLRTRAAFNTTNNLSNDSATPTLAQIVVLDIDELLVHDFPPMEELLSPWLCKQHLSMVHAWRGVLGRFL